MLETRERILIAKEAEANAKEKRLLALQRDLAKRERDITSKESQLQAMKSTITHLERRVSELKGENHLLNCRLASLEDTQRAQENETNYATTTPNDHREHREANPRGQQCHTCTSCDRERRDTPYHQTPQIIIAPNFGTIGHREMHPAQTPSFSSMYPAQPPMVHPYHWPQPMHSMHYPAWMMRPQPQHPFDNYARAQPVGGHPGRPRAGNVTHRANARSTTDMPGRAHIPSTSEDPRAQYYTGHNLQTSKNNHPHLNQQESSSNSTPNQDSQKSR